MTSLEFLRSCCDPNPKSDPDAARLEPRDFAAQVREVLHLVDPFELRGKRLCALRLDRGLVHAAGVVVAELLLIRARSRLLLRQLLEDLPHRRPVALGELRERPPRRVLRRDRVLLEPAAVGVLVERLAGVGGGVHVARDRVRGRRQRPPPASHGSNWRSGRAPRSAIPPAPRRQSARSRRAGASGEKGLKDSCFGSSRACFVDSVCESYNAGRGRREAAPPRVVSQFEK